MRTHHRTDSPAARRATTRSRLRRRFAAVAVTLLLAALPALAGPAFGAIAPRITTAAPSPKLHVTYDLSARDLYSRPCGGSRIAKPGGGYWACTWSDEFSGSSLDSTHWWPMDTTTKGFRTGDECFDPANVAVRNGQLLLTSTKAPAPFDCKGRTAQYRSGMISTQGLFAQAYGRFEMRAKFPPGVGFQPAFWLLPQNPVRDSGYYYGEIDVVEHWGNYPNIASPHLHYVYTPGTLMGGAYCSVPGTSTAFHTYAVEWTQTSMKFVYDGRTCWQTSWAPGQPYAPAGAAAPAPFDQPFYVMVELAMGGDSTPANRPTASTAFPATMQVDYVRVWK